MLFHFISSLLFHPFHPIPLIFFLSISFLSFPFSTYAFSFPSFLLSPSPPSPSPFNNTRFRNPKLDGVTGHNSQMPLRGVLKCGSLSYLQTWLDGSRSLACQSPGRPFLIEAHTPTKKQQQPTMRSFCRRTRLKNLRHVLTVPLSEFLKSE